MNKIFAIIVLLVFVLISAVVLFTIFDYFYPKPQPEVPQTENVAPAVLGKTETAYGVKMQENCFAGFQDFLKNYGQDYSKCLDDFQFSDEYCGGFNPDTQGLSDANVIVILDSSGSMAEQVYSEVKIDVAKKAVSDFLSQMPSSINTGLVVYGQKGSNSTADKSLSCNGIEEVVKLGKNNSTNIISAMNSFNPRGWTPIAGALDYAKNIFLQKGADDKDYLILVSDGIESCDGDPIAAAENLRTAIPGVQLSIIGFAPDNATRNFLTRVATSGGGSYFDTYNSTDISKAFNKQLLLIKKDCISVTLVEASLKYKNNNLKNLNCWLDLSGKEKDDFNENVQKNSSDAECNQEISDAVVARQKDYWYQKQAIEDKNGAIYNELETNLNGQLQALENSRDF